MERRARPGGLPKYSTTAGGSVAEPVEETTMTRILTMAYGVIAYLLFLVTFLWAIAFVLNLPTATTIDGRGGNPSPLAEALVVDFALLGLFAMQHSIMARRWFKQWLAGIMPPAIE